MTANNVLFLGAYTGRTQAYLQAIAHHQLTLSYVIAYGSREQKNTGNNLSSEPQYQLDVFIPDLSISVDDTIKENKWDHKTISCNHINDDKIFDEIIDHEIDFIIYSGYGGQIVGDKLINLGIPILHLHSGWLPEYRGSTTLYYSILNQDKIGVSAILLNSEIDKGDIIKKKKYPLPPAGMDIDYLYDSSIRADLLVEVLAMLYSQSDEFQNITQGNKGETYYVIHPVLKHIAIMSLK